MTQMLERTWTFLYFAWLAAILWLSLDPSPPQIDVGPLGWDKFQHAAAYFVMTLLGSVGLCRWIRPQGRCRLASAGIAVFLGICVEAAQYWMRAGRFAEWQDAVANVSGVTSALIVITLFDLFRTRRCESR